MARYHFETTMRISAPRRQVWDVIEHPKGWPKWSRWLKRVDELAAGDERGLGARHRMHFGTALPYTLSFEMEVVQLDPPERSETRASGELAGAGIWQLTELDDGSTTVVYTWLVETTKRWMNMLAPIARPAFSWNHDVLMRDFARGLAAAAGGELLEVENRTFKPRSAGFAAPPGS